MNLRLGTRGARIVFRGIRNSEKNRENPKKKPKTPQNSENKKKGRISLGFHSDLRVFIDFARICRGPQGLGGIIC